VNRRHLYVLATTLAAIGLLLFFYKAYALKFPLTPDTDIRLWDVEARVAFMATGKPVRASLLVPKDTRRYNVTNERFVASGYGANFDNEGPNRLLTWSIREASGWQILYYRATARWIRDREPAVPGEKPAALEPDFDGAGLAAARAVLKDIRARSADVQTMVSELLKQLQQSTTNTNLQALLGDDFSLLNRMRTAERILRLENVPARVAHGVRLGEDLERNTQVVHWLQVFDGNLWRSFDPETGEPHVPDDYFTWWRGSIPILHVKGGEQIQWRISVAPNREPAIQHATQRAKVLAPQLMEFSLFRLPVEAQAVYHILLLVPVGAFILVLLRNVVGLKTFGTFMPVLIALAFRETLLLWGIVLFTVIVSLGLIIRFYLDRLKLLLVPRLAAVLTIVVLLMALISIIGFKLGLERGVSVALFPMVILTMTIERMSIVWEERGSRLAIQQGVGSLAAASLAYLVMNIAELEHLLFVFPELLLVLLAVLLLLGRYSGYRLTELSRFKVLGGD